MRYSLLLIDFFVSLVTAHFADSILQDDILLEEMVDRHLALSIVMHRALQEEAEEALRTIATLTCSKVREQYEVEQERSSKNRVTTEEIDLYLHRITHPTENINVIPTFLIVVTRRVVIDTYLVVVIGVKIRLFVSYENAFKRRKLRYFLGMEVGWLIKYKSITVAQDIG